MKTIMYNRVVAKRHETNLVLSDFSVENLGPIPKFSAQKLGMINLILGENSCGKTFLMKMLYSACKAMETYKKGKNIAPLAEVVETKLYWTFQSDPLTNIISKKLKKADRVMSFSCTTTSGESLEVQMSAEGRIKVSDHPQAYGRAIDGKKINSVFLPAKEVLTSHPIIVASRDDDAQFGFDDTYYDLAKILLRPSTKGKSYANMAKARSLINGIFDAKAVYDGENKKWFIQKGNDQFDVSEASEGIKKLSILDILLGNKYIGPGSIIFIDEPESALHPAAISQFMDAVFQMSKDGIQFFMATHSYFVVKKLENIARKNKMDIPVFSYQTQSNSQSPTPAWVTGNMKEGLPDNPIMRESVALYKEDLERYF